MTPARFVLLAMIVTLAAFNSPLSATDKPPTLEKQLTELRNDLADTRLQLQHVKSELKDIQQFLAEKNLAEKLVQWRTERNKLAEERRLLAMERARLNASRKALHQTTTRLAQQAAGKQLKQQQQQNQALGPRWNARYEIGLIDKQQATIYVDNTNGQVLVDQYPSVDRHNVFVRGTFINRSLMPWRYTFEIRLASAQPIGLGTRKILASWPYQTPLLTPGELHNFKVKLHLTNGDVSDINIVQIGRVTADRPADPKTAAPPVPPTPATQVNN